MRIPAAHALPPGVTLVLLGSPSLALSWRLRLSLDPVDKGHIKGVKVGSQLLLSVNRYETIQSLQGEHIPFEVGVSELVEVFKRLQELLTPVFFLFKAESDRHNPKKLGERLIDPFLRTE